MNDGMMDTRRVYYCGKCGWESFDIDAYNTECGQTNCDGKLDKIRDEDYEV